jgi:HSP20 family molecular chaperone IbpA
MDYLFQLVLEPVDEPLLPKGESPEPVNLYPDITEAEVIELDDEVIVTINLIPGGNTTTFSCDLINEKTFAISCDQKYVKMAEQVDYTITEQRLHSLRCEIHLPATVTSKGAKATIKNGVLDIHFMKTQPRYNKTPVR